MLETVVLHLGALTEGLRVRWAWAENRIVLAERGLCHPDPSLGFEPQLRDIIERRPEAQNGFLPLDEPFTKEFQERLRHTAGQSAARVLYFNFSSCFSKLSVLPLLRSLLQDTFPQAKIRAFISLPRYDNTLEGQFAVAHFNGASPGVLWLGRQAENLICKYADGLKAVFSVFGRENVTCFMPDFDSGGQDFVKGIKNTTLASQAAFWRFAGVELPPEFITDAANGLACFWPQAELCLPPEFLAFCRVCNNLSKEKYTIFTSPWREQSARFVDWGDFFSVVSPKERAAFVAARTKDHLEAAALLGRDRLFAPVDENQPWEPFTGLTEETAFAVARRLTTDFAQECLAKFEAAPVQFLTTEQRICRRALHDVLDPPSAVPLSHRGRQPKVSVCTLAYNHAAFIGECIEGVIAQQTDFPIQHIIADDCSNDGTPDIILDYAARYPHIVPIFQPKRSRGRNNISTMFEMARTEYVALCDGDDFFTDPLKLQAQVDLLDANPEAGLCFHKVRVAYEGHTKPDRIYPPEEALPRGIRPFYYLVDLLRNNFIQTNSVMYRWRFRSGLPGWFRTDLTPADRYWHLLHAEMGKIAFIDKVMSVYRRHEKGAFYLSEVDKLKHRAKVGIREIEVYDVINKHFDRKYEPILLDLILHIYADCLLYDARQEEEGIVEEPMLFKLSDKYPEFTRHFLASVNMPPKE